MMDREEALAAFATLETRTVSYLADSAEEEEWIDENTPPTRHHPVLDVRLDATISGDGDREWRLFVRTHQWLDAGQTADATIDVIQVAREAGGEISLANAGIEIT